MLDMRLHPKKGTCPENGVKFTRVLPVVLQKFGQEEKQLLVRTMGSPGLQRDPQKVLATSWALL